ncbi:lectin subunit alpha-like [Lucilia sericata]|uniref:lectin subunit alpha-like n=1 Tax=Lucilia sericata TaxID=13632 RepID=UPI0018A81EAC|nr:lectin subunit alpha-like [Lucilia sericata]
MYFGFLCQITVIVFIFKINEINSAGQFYTTIENKQYYVDKNNKYTFDNSILECLKLNMTLIAIDSMKEEEAITQLLLNKNNFSSLPKLWIGGVIIPGTRTAVWISTGKLFDNWYRGNPDYDYPCILVGWDSKTQWTDYICTKKYGFICEYPSERKLQEEHEKLKDELKTENEKNDYLQKELNKEKELSENLKQQLEVKVMEENADQQLVLPSSIEQPAAPSLESVEPDSCEVPNNQPQGYSQQFLFSHVQNAYFMPNRY